MKMFSFANTGPTYSNILDIPEKYDFAPNNSTPTFEYGKNKYIKQVDCLHHDLEAEIDKFQERTFLLYFKFRLTRISACSIYSYSNYVGEKI